MGKPIKKRNQKVYKSYSVVQFVENGKKLFECIPDIWFCDDEKSFCFWPPKFGKAFKLRALNYEKPEVSWEKVQCNLVRDGYSTYSSGFDKVKEKCSQKFNTSSADEQMEALNFRRKHPVLTLQAKASFEHLFSQAKEVNVVEPNVVNVVEPNVVNVAEPNVVNVAESNEVNVVEPKEAEPNLLKVHSGKGAETTKVTQKSKESVKADVSRRSTKKEMEVEKWMAEKSLKTNRGNCSPSGSRLSQSQALLSSDCTNSPPCSRSSSCVRLKDIYSRTRTARRSSDRSPAYSSTRLRSSPRSNHTNNSSSRPPVSSSVATQSNSRSTSRSRGRSTISQRSHSSHTRSRSRSTLQSRIHRPRERSSSSDSYRQGRLSRSNGSREKTPIQTKSSLELMTEMLSTVKQNHASNDRRLTRMEVTINKVFVTVADMKRSNNFTSPSDRHRLRRSRSSQRSRSASTHTPRVPKGFKIPILPIRDMKELTFFNKNLKKDKFREFMLKHEKEFCTPAKTTNNVTMIAYLKRFISLELRCLVTLKDNKGVSNYTLYNDFKRVYDFLIDVMKMGFRSYGERIKTDEVHVTLRTVWGRSKQMLKEKKRKSIK